MCRQAQLLCGFVCVVGCAACGFPRPLVNSDAGGSDAATEGSVDGGADCMRLGYPSLSWPATSSPRIAVADLNRDGKVDLITTHQSTIGVLLGNGDGLFQPEVEYPVNMVRLGGLFSLPIRSLVVADLNNDGRLDI